MVRRIGFLVLAALLSLPAGGFAQSTGSVSVEVPSGADTMMGQLFLAPAGEGRATVLLIPGWPGNPHDVLGLGARLVQRGVNVLMFNPRGMHESSGTMTFAHALEDMGAAFGWLHEPDVVRRFQLDTSIVALGGHSFGGGMAMAYAAQDARVRRLVSIAGTDHAVLIREFDANPSFSERILRMLSSTRAPDGPIRFDLDGTLEELRGNMDIYGLRENAARLADRAILMFGGWEDTGTTIDQFMLPLYRALRAGGAGDVTFLVYHTDHNFTNTRDELAAAIADWLLQE